MGTRGAAVRLCFLVGLALLVLGWAVGSRGAFPAPGAGPGPGPLAREFQRYWDQDPVIWQEALLDLLLDPSNPLRLSESEQAAVQEAVVRVALAEARLEARRSFLFRAWRRVWRVPREAGSGAVGSEAFLDCVARAAPAIRARATVPGRSPLPDPDYDEPQVDYYLTDDEPFQAIVPAEAQLSLGQIGRLALEVQGELSEEEATAGLPELLEMRRLASDCRAGWLILARLATRGHRAPLVLETARRPRRRPPDSGTLSRRMNVWAEAHLPPRLRNGL